MKKILLLLTLAILSIGVVACSSNADSKKNNNQSSEEKGKVEDKETNNNDTINNNDDAENGEQENSDIKTSNGKFKDQTNLKIGDTGQAESTVGRYEITINSVKMKDEIDEQSPSLDHFFVAEVTVKNIGNKPIDAIEPIKTLELTSNPDGGGNGDDSSFYKSIKALTGVIEPGKSVSGEAVFQEMDAKTYYLRTNVGLIASKAVKNKTTWTFEKSEAK